MTWSLADIPDLTGKTAVVTGANSGIGLVTASELARAGASVTLAVRDAGKGGTAQMHVNLSAAAPRANGRPGTPAGVEILDLADLSSVRDFAKRWQEGNPAGLDLLINNAGVMAIPREVTVDGFERQLATNHLGHFALTGLLLPALAARPGSRVVTVSSNAHRFGRMDFDDLMGAKSYSPWKAYGQSKLANLLFTFELQRRLDRARLAVLAVASHPGYAATNLTSSGPVRDSGGLQRSLFGAVEGLLAQPADSGAWPSLMAATSGGLPGGSYLGPDGFFRNRGRPRIEQPSEAAKDRVVAERLWEVSEELTGVRFAQID